MMKNMLLAATILGSWIFWALPAGAEITMKLSDLCGAEANDWEVEIWNPPGGYVKDISEDGTFTANVEEGHKLSAMAPCFCVGSAAQCEKGPRWCNSSSPWTPAKDGGELEVNCGGGM